MASEKRLIDANELTKKFWREECRTQTRRDFVAMVDYAPTVDAVEVVRCKDCKCGKYPESIRLVGKFVKCALYDPMPMMRCNDFCSYGERKDK